MYIIDNSNSLFKIVLKIFSFSMFFKLSGKAFQMTGPQYFRPFGLSLEFIKSLDDKLVFSSLRPP